MPQRAGAVFEILTRGRSTSWRAADLSHTSAPDRLELGPRLADVAEFTHRGRARRRGILTVRDQFLRARLDKWKVISASTSPLTRSSEKETETGGGFLTCAAWDASTGQAVCRILETAAA